LYESFNTVALCLGLVLLSPLIEALQLDSAGFAWSPKLGHIDTDILPRIPRLKVFFLQKEV